MKTEFSQQILEKYSNIKCDENPLSASRLARFGRTNGRTDGQTDMMKVIVSFHNFVYLPKKEKPVFLGQNSAAVRSKLKKQ
jgi:hypothetical protein